MEFLGRKIELIIMLLRLFASNGCFYAKLRAACEREARRHNEDIRYISLSNYVYLCEREIRNTYSLCDHAFDIYIYQLSCEMHF